MRGVCKMKNEQEYIILQIQEDDYGCEERPVGAKRTVFVRLKDAKENENIPSIHRPVEPCQVL